MIDEPAPKPTARYWARLSGDALAAQIASRFLEYQRELEMRGVLSLWRVIQQTYFGYDPSTDSYSSGITEGGSSGEYLKTHVNQFRSFLAHQLALTTGDALAFDVMASNNSPESEAQTTLARALLEHYETKIGSESVAPKRVSQCERMFLFGAGYMTKTWDATIGPEVGTMDVPIMGADGSPVMQMEGESQGGALPPGIEQPQPAYETKIRRAGDIVTAVYGPQDVARDLGVKSHASVRYYVIRERVDRWELAARFPEHAQYITERPAFDSDETVKSEKRSSSLLLKTDQIHVLRLLHDRCPQLEEGMEALVCGERLLGPALPLAYPRLPVHVMVADEHLDRALGYPPCQNLLGLQAAHNAAWIAGITRADAGALPKWAISRKCNVEHRKLGSDGMVIEYDIDPQAVAASIPVLMQVPSITEADLALIDRTESAMESQSGVNAVVRGKSEGKSGADNALIQAQAVQSQSRFMQAYTSSARSDALGTIECFQTFADDERTISVIGEDEAPTIEYVSKEKIKDVRSVEVSLGDPVSRTAAGRMALADSLAEKFPRQVDADRYMEVVSTGRLDPIWRAQQNEVRLIRSENISLAKGNPIVKDVGPEEIAAWTAMAQQAAAAGMPPPPPPQPQRTVQAAICDNHMAHIREHLALLSSPSLRSNQVFAKAVLDHVQEHELMWMQLIERPALLAATGQPPPPMPGMPAPTEGDEHSGASDAPGSGGAPKAEKASVAGADVGGMPSAPKNAATGEPAQINH